jgi:hypothetical protein
VARCKTKSIYEIDVAMYQHVFTLSCSFNKNIRIFFLKICVSLPQKKVIPCKSEKRLSKY